jgi:dolichol kinase
VRSRVAAQEGLRKLAHVAGGLSPPVFVLIFGWAGSVALAAFLLAYLLIAWDMERRGIHLPLLSAVVASTRREHESTPVAAAQFLLMILLLGVLLPLPYFFAAIAVLAVGDGFASVAGRRWGRRALPWNRSKSWAGLAVGAGAGTAAFVAYALVGANMRRAGYETGERLLDAPPLLVVPATLIVAFLILHVAAWLAVRAGVPQRANASAAVTLAAFAAALAVPVALLSVAPLGPPGPWLPVWGGHGPITQALLLLAPLAAMLAESYVDRNDNVWVPAIAALVAYGIAGIFRGLLGL